jgi:biopolymer transport protein ExbD
MEPRGNSGRKRVPEFRNLNLVPLLDFIVAVIPVLLLSVNFLEYVVLDTSLPAYSEDAYVETSGKDEQPKIGLSIAITEQGFVIAGQGGLLNTNGKSPLISRMSDGSYDYATLGDRLFEIKNNYPDEWSVIIIPESTTRFDDIVGTMDAARERLSIDHDGKAARKTMFPNIVLGGGIL